MISFKDYLYLNEDSIINNIKNIDTISSSSWGGDYLIRCRDNTVLDFIDLTEFIIIEFDIRMLYICFRYIKDNYNILTIDDLGKVGDYNLSYLGYLYTILISKNIVSYSSIVIDKMISSNVSTNDIRLTVKDTIGVSLNPIIYNDIINEEIFTY
jgi:hypothetical protein